MGTVSRQESVSNGSIQSPYFEDGYFPLKIAGEVVLSRRGAQRNYAGT